MDTRKLRFFVTGLVMMLFGITMVVVGTINDFLTSTYQVDKIFIGFCASMLTTGILVGSFTFGAIVEFYGYKPIMILGILFVIIGIEGIIYAPYVSVIPYLFLLIGVGGGVINGVTNLIVAILYPENAGAWISLLGVFYGVGAFGFPLLTSILLDSGLDYQAILFITGLVLVIPLVFVLFVKFPAPKREKPVKMREYLGFFTKPAIIIIGLVLFFQSAVEAILPTWAPTFLKDTFHVDYSRALYAITVSCVSIALTRLFLSQLLKKVSSFKVLLFSSLVAMVGILIMGLGPKFWVSLSGIALIGVGLAASFPVMLDYAADVFPGYTGIVFSIVIGIALVGNILLNLLTGYILQLLGMSMLSVLLILFVSIIIALLYAVKYKIIKQ